jgi:uncharacterized membrane protein YkvA (DUF1232 family)
MKKLGVLQSIWNHLRVAWRLFRDERVPLWTKAIPVLAVIYLISPLDFLPDIVPVLGQLDDLTVILLGLQLFERMAPEWVVREHQNDLGVETSDSIDVPTIITGDEKPKR